MNLDVTYRKDALIGAVGPSVWAKLGPEKWFDAYRLVAANARGYTPPFVVDLQIQAGDLERFTTTAITLTPQFLSIANDELKDYKFIIYRPVEPIEGFPMDRFVANDISFRRYEDKKIFRDVFNGVLPIPEYETIDLDEFLQLPPAQILESYSQRLGSPFVLQDSSGGGGRSTFIISTIQDIERAIAILELERQGTHAVISRFKRGIERSMQVFVSDQHIVRGPLQQQLVRNDELLDPFGRGGMFFCGGRLVTGWSDALEQQLDTIVTKAADALRASGYRGIFGIDFIVTEDETIYTIEINARTTGLLPLLNEQSVAVPPYLLHILELAEEQYSLTSNAAVDWRVKTDGPGSFVILFNTTGEKAYLSPEITTGNYTFTNGKLEKLDDQARWNPDADVMLQLFAAEDFPSKPNLKLTNIFLKDEGFDDNGKLSHTAHEVVQYLKEHVVTIAP